MSLMVKDIPLYKGRKLTDKEARISFFEPDVLRNFADGAKISESDQIVLEGQPGGYLLFDMPIARLSLKGESRMSLYIVFYNQKLISQHGHFLSRRNLQQNKGA